MGVGSLIGLAVLTALVWIALVTLARLSSLFTTLRALAIPVVLTLAAGVLALVAMALVAALALTSLALISLAALSLVALIVCHGDLLWLALASWPTRIVVSADIAR